MPHPFSLAPAGSTVSSDIAAVDWEATSLGPVERWPASLRVLLKTMFACPSPMFLAWGPDLLSFYNDAYRPMLGYRADSAMGTPFRELWSSIWDEISPLVDEALAGGAPKVTDMRLDLARDGMPEESYWTFSYSPAFDDDGQIAGMLCVTSETTARILMERERDAADERLQLALSAGNSIGIWDWDVVHDTVKADHHFATLYGVDPERAAVGAPIAEFFACVSSEDLPRIKAEIDTAIRHGTPFHSEYRLLRPDGSTRWVSAQGSCLYDEDGNCVRFPGVSYDITDRVAAEEKIRASEAVARANAARVQLALEAGAIIGTWFWDLQEDRFTVDEPFARNFGIDPVLGRHGLTYEQIVANVHPDDKPGLTEAIANIIRQGGNYAHQYRVRRSDGQHYWIEANGRVDHAPDGTPLSFPGVLIDVDSRRMLEQERDRALADLRALTNELEQRVAERSAELIRAEDALRQSQKMEAVGQLTGGLAHDFNNLLAGISGALELMDVRLTQGRPNDVEKYMVAAKSATRRAAALTHRLLAFSRRQTLAPVPTDVNALVSGMSELIQRTVGPAIAVETVAGQNLWTALVDQSQLENALLNLCINARDAMPDGGSITIETANKRLDREAALHHGIAEGQYLALCVSDTGTGMAPDVIAKAFEPFFTTKPLGQGTGLGLSMIYGFAQQSGGQVRIYSEVGVGTNVHIFLPRHHGGAAPVANDIRRAPVDMRCGAGETILLVDDEPTVRLLVTEVLNDLGYTVLEAHDSAAGLRILQSDVHIDLLITDVGLPGGMNGRQMADAGREIRPTLQILFITGYAENAILNHGLLEPGMAILTKPFTIEAMKSRIRDALPSK
ncbi:MAG: PAS domain-containing protein [Sphingobium sp.]